LNGVPRSTLIAVASPLIAVALTIGTFAILFAIMGKNPLLALWPVEGDRSARARCASNDLLRSVLLSCMRSTALV